MMNMKSSDAFWNTVKSREAFLDQILVPHFSDVERVL